MKPSRVMARTGELEGEAGDDTAHETSQGEGKNGPAGAKPFSGRGEEARSFALLIDHRQATEPTGAHRVLGFGHRGHGAANGAWTPRTSRRRTRSVYAELLRMAVSSLWVTRAVHWLS